MVATPDFFEDFEDETLQLVFTTTDAPDWVRTTALADTGTYSFRSGTITHNEVSETSFTIEVDPGRDGTLAIRYLANSEANFDYLRIYLDDVQQVATSGTANSWATLSLTLPAGTHTIRLRYSKDGSASAGQDGGFIDNITYSSAAATGQARVSQLATEVLRINLAPAAQVSQHAVEVLRPNVARADESLPWVFDTFTDYEDRDLNVHIPEVGGRWSAVLGYSQLFPLNAANDWVVGASSSSSSAYLNGYPLPTADYRVDAKVRLTHATSGDRVGILGRFTTTPSTRSGWWFYYDGTQWRLELEVDNALTNLATVAGYDTLNTDYDITLVFDGDTVSAFINDTPVLSALDYNFAQTKGHAGILARSGGVVTQFSAAPLVAVESYASQMVVEALMSPDPAVLWQQGAVELLILPHADAYLSQAVVEVMSRGPEVVEFAVSVEMEADLYIGTALATSASPLRMDVPVTLSSPELKTGTPAEASLAISVTMSAALSSSTSMAATMNIGVSLDGQLRKGIELDCTMSLPLDMRATLIVYPETDRNFFIMF